MIKAKKIYIFLSLFFLSKDTIGQFPLFENNDRVCFIGNSITMDGKFHNYIELYYATRFPDKKIKFYNCGISGDVTGGILKRMESDILVHKPTWSVLMIGMNDVNRSLYAKERESELGIKQKQQDALTKYFINVDSIVRVLIKADSKVILQTPSIYDQTVDNTTPNLFGVNDALHTCADYLKTLASKYNLPVVDYWTAMNHINKKVQKTDVHATIVGRDRVHPNVAGHFLMAYKFLGTQKVPSHVSFISVGARRHKIKTRNCNINDMEYNAGISFSCRELSLPYPRLRSFNADSLIPFTNELNKELLQIKSLKKGNYLLIIDSTIIGRYSKQELKAGVNLATNMLTPQYQQAAKVLQILTQSWDIETTLRQIKYVEHGLMGGEMKDIERTNDELKILFEKRLERFRGQTQSNIEFYQRHFKEYLVNKPLEKELLEKLNHVYNEIHLVNKPVQHNYQIIKVDPYISMR